MNYSILAMAPAAAIDEACRAGEGWKWDGGGGRLSWRPPAFHERAKAAQVHRASLMVGWLIS